MATAVVAAEPRADLAAVEAAVDAFCAGFDPAVMTASDAAEVVRRLAVVERKVVAVKAGAGAAGGSVVGVAPRRVPHPG